MENRTLPLDSLPEIINELLSANPNTVRVEVNRPGNMVAIFLNGEGHMGGHLEPPTAPESVLELVKPKVPENYVVQPMVLWYRDSGIGYFTILRKPNSS